MLDRRWPRLAAAALVAVVSVVSGCNRTRHPNVLLVTIDTLRADRCSAYGNSVPTTPYMERLAAGGVLFKQAYAPMPTTAPSHAALLTARYPRSLALLKNGHTLAEEELTLSEVLSAEGYATAAFVSSLPLKARYGFGQGFEHFDDAFVVETASLGRGDLPKAHDRRGGATAELIVEWLERRKDRRPLFLWMHIVDPHAPYKAPDPFKAAWPRGTKGGRKRYDAEVRYADKQVARVAEALERAGNGHGNLTVVTSDHGEGLADHGWMSHGIQLYQEAMHVPLVVAWPGRLAEGRVVEEAVELTDVAPGILRLLGVDVPEAFQGVDMLGDELDRPVYFQRRAYKSKKVKKRRVAGEMWAVVAGDMKLIKAPEETGYELYDLAADPREYADLASQRPAEVERLDGLIEAWNAAFPPVEREQPPISEEDQRALRALGYVE